VLTLTQVTKDKHTLNELLITESQVKPDYSV
jgi:hypothetical protein